MGAAVFNKAKVLMLKRAQAGRRTERQVLEEFLDTFGVRDGSKRTIASGDFEEYYEKISASCEDDNYFQVLRRRLEV